MLKSTRGKPKLCLDGFVYNLQTTLKNGRPYWRCERRTAKCRGTLTTSRQHDDIKLFQRHNHDPCQDRVDALRALTHMREQCEAGVLDTAAIKASSRIDIPESAQRLIKRNRLTRMVARAKAKQRKMTYKSQNRAFPTT